MRLETIDPDIHVLVGETYNSNSTVFVNGEDALLIDGMASREDAEELREFVETQLKKQVRFIVCTHYFSDHLAALKLFPAARIIAHKNYMHTFASERFRSEEEEAHFVEPNVLISDGVTIRWGRHTLDIFHNPGHTMSTLGIDVPEADLLLAGDTIVGNMVYMSYSAPEMFLPALKRLQRRGRSRFLTSHLGVRTSDAIDNALCYLERLRQRVEAARRSSENGDSILSIELGDCLPDGVEGTSFENIFHKRNLESIIERRLFAQA
ncbi:MAG: MBL fold metallo-hydrolase [Blastocatellia bacterium]|nr:MBL fold metallo-hydrolase [Blastocatellia bacterium]